MDNIYVDNEGKKSSNGEGSTKAEKAKWEDEINLIFIDLCGEEIRKGNRLGTCFSKDGWKSLVKEFNKKSGKNYTKAQLKNHWDKLKKEWRLFRNLMRGETGLGFDASRNTITVDNQWWGDKIAENNDYKTFRDKDLSLFWYRYDAIFSDIVATGERARAPSEIDSTIPWNEVYPSHTASNKDTHVENENMEGSDCEDLQYDYGAQNLGGMDDTFRDDESLFPPTPNLNKRPVAGTSGKKRKTSASAALKEDINSLLKLISTKSSPSVASHEGPTITQCMDIFKNLPGISLGTGIWFYGCNLFAKKEQREIFMGQPDDELKLKWLNWNYSEYCNRKGA